MMREQRGELRVPAIEVRQSPGRLLYSFAVDGKQIPSFATISRIRRNGTELQGYQRPEVLSHIAEIRTYLESDSPMVPNAVVVAFDHEWCLNLRTTNGLLQYARAVRRIPLTRHCATKRSQVSSSTVSSTGRSARPTSHRLICVIFVTNDITADEQFILVNSTAVAEGLIYEPPPIQIGASDTAGRRFPLSSTASIEMPAAA
jgi:DGQHR domain-containing protein